jgi:hypothetical protein
VKVSQENNVFAVPKSCYEHALRSLSTTGSSTLKNDARFQSAVMQIEMALHSPN